MEQLSFLEKLGVLFQSILAHPIFICVLFSPVLIIFLNKKIKKKAIVFIYIIILLFVLYVGNTTIFALFDNLMDNIFMALYFPNFITLFMVELISAIICLISFIKKGINKTNRIVNIVSFVIIQTIFVLILTIIQANEIDIYKENALYSNNDILTLMQLLMGTFALQIIILVTTWAIEKVTFRLDNPNEKQGIHRPLEGRITHATLEGAKVINKKAEVVIEMPKMAPLDKSLIESTKINPLYLKDEIIKEKNDPLKKEPLEQLVIPPKPKVEIKYVTPEVKLDPLKPQDPLNKQLILDTHIVPKDVNEEIKLEKEKLKEIKVSNELSKMAQNFGKDKFVFPIPQMKPQAPLDKKLIGKEKISPIDVNEAIIDEKLQVKESTKPVLNSSFKKSKDKKIKKQRTSIRQKLKAVKEIKVPTVLKPIEEDKAVFTVFDKSSPFRYVESASEVLDVSDKASNFITDDVLVQNTSNETKPDLMKPMEKEVLSDAVGNAPKLDASKTQIKEEKELIANLEIVNYDKMVKAIKDLKIIYTL